MQPGSVLGARYQIVRTLGEGGMGLVYEAIDRVHDTRVALKTVRVLTGDSLSRFKREFRALADVNHPNLVQLGELRSDADSWFFTMELVDGESFLFHVRPGARWQPVDAPGPAPLDGPAPLRPSAGMAALAATERFTREGGSGFDERRLRSAIAQLTSALSAVHEAGLVHRDVKPSNVLITRQGRTVLLDFGLVGQATTSSEQNQSAIVGTPVYMAPEQAGSSAVGPPADLYSVGVLLYEALAGAPPFRGSPLEILMAKQKAPPLPPSALASDVPPDLETLCLALLDRDPARRPDAGQILRALGVASRDSITPRPLSGAAAAFVGRAEEMAMLRQTFDRVRETLTAASVVIEGESGVGKSCLVRRFVSSLRADVPEVVVLPGRCYEREAVPYKAVDGMVDALASFLHSVPAAQAAEVLPTRPSSLAQVFPVLRQIEGFFRTAGTLQLPDPVELRSQAFSALREMLDRLANRRPLVVVIDDLQWADPDGMALLAHILRPPRAPPMLLVATVRLDAAGGSPLPSLPGEVTRVALGRLSDSESRALARELLRPVLARIEGPAEIIARDAGGHPLFIEALARHLATSGSEHVIRLEDAIWITIEAIGASARRVLELVAVAGAPVAQSIVASAAGTDPDAFARDVSLLRAAHLVTTAGGRRAGTIDAYHDRVRTSLMGHLPADTLAASHHALAMALERAGAGGHEALARHWRGAGDVERAALHAGLAGDDAAAALAFDRAASLYQLAMDLGADTPSLWERLGHALANAGRGAAAAQAFRHAARDAAAATALDLRRRAADQLLRGGHIEEGLAAIRSLLAAMGLELPRSPLLALLSFLVTRAFLRLRGLGFTRRDETQIAAERLMYMDLCYTISFGLGLVEPMRGAAFQARNLLLALRAGEPYRVARALAAEAAYSSRSGGPGWPRTKRLLDSARTLAEQSRHPHAIGWASCAEGIAAYLNGRFSESLGAMQRAAQTWRGGCTGVAWEIDSAQAFALWSLAQLGELAELRRLQPDFMRDARERGDLYGWVLLCSGDSILGWLAEGDVTRARHETAEAMAHWPRESFLVEHFYELVALTHTDLYGGSPRDALQRVARSWRPLRRSLMPATIQLVRVQSLHCRARAALAVAEADADEQLLREAERDARRIEAERMPWATPLGMLVRAGVERCRRHPERAIALLRDAAAGFGRTGTELYAASARRCLGGLLGGDEGVALRSASEAWMKAQSVQDPARMTAALAPGFGDFG